MRRDVLVLAAITAIAGCADDAPADGCPAETDGLRVIAPGGAVELMPGGAPALVTWAPPLDMDGVLILSGMDSGLVSFDVQFSSGEQSIEADGLEPDVYDPTLAVNCTESIVRVIPSSAVQLIYRQGATMSPNILSWAAETPAEDRMFEIRTVSLSTMELELLAGTQVLVRASIPGELVAMNRSYAFTGVDVDDAPLPGGMYPLTLRIRARDGITYDRPGPTFYWAP